MHASRLRTEVDGRLHKRGQAVFAGPEVLPGRLPCLAHGIRSVAVNFLCDIARNYSALLSRYSVRNSEHPASAGNNAVVMVMDASMRAAAMIAAAHRIAFAIWNF